MRRRRFDPQDVAAEAARLMLDEGIKEYYTAKRLAADRLGARRLPSNRQIRSVIVALTSIDAERRRRRLRRLREVAVAIMEQLEDLQPRLIGSVASGAVHAESDVDIHVFTVDEEGLLARLREAGCDPVRKVRPVVKDGRLNRFVHVRFDVEDVYVELSVYPPAELHRVSYSSIDGKPIDRVPLGRVRALRKG
ncbi:MAG: nucleotidyltransferase domain-containing protein [Myxococcota bacterium]